MIPAYIFAKEHKRYDLWLINTCVVLSLGLPWFTLIINDKVLIMFLWLSSVIDKKMSHPIWWNSEYLRIYYLHSYVRTFEWRYYIRKNERRRKANKSLKKIKLSSSLFQFDRSFVIIFSWSRHRDMYGYAGRSAVCETSRTWFARRYGYSKVRRNLSPAWGSFWMRLLFHLPSRAEDTCRFLARWYGQWRSVSLAALSPWLRRCGLHRSPELAYRARRQPESRSCRAVAAD